MNVLMIVPEPFFQPRGTPFSVYYRARTMASLGHRIDLVTYPFGREVTIPGVRIHRSARVPLVRDIKIGPSAAKLFLDIPLFFKALWMLARNDYDVVHVHEEAAFFAVFYKLVFWRTKILYDMHSSLPQQLRNFKFSSNRLLIGVFDLFERLSLRIASAIITICPELQKTVDDMKLNVPSTLIENTLFDNVELSEQADAIGDGLIDWSRFEGKNVVLYSGTFEPYQGLPMLMEAAVHVLAARPDTVFLMVGGNPAQVETLRKIAVALKIKPSVIFTGNLPPATIKSFLRRANVLVSPRIKGTNTPLKIYEFLASGKPIVATRLPTHTQVLTDNEAILAGADAASFADGILAALTDSFRAAAVSRGAQELYQRAYSPELYRAKLTNLLARLSKANAPVAAAVAEAR